MDIKKYRKEYYKKNKEKHADCMKKYYRKNRKKILLMHRLWQLKNPNYVKKTQKKYYHKNKEKRLVYHKQWVEKNKHLMRDKFRAWIAKKTPEELKKYYARTKKTKINNYLYRTYGITTKEYKKIYKKQGGRCKICGKHQRSCSRKFHVDHCHKTGVIRSLLCFGCNSALGTTKENITTLKNMIKYIRSHILKSGVT